MRQPRKTKYIRIMRDALLENELEYLKRKYGKELLGDGEFIRWLVHNLVIPDYTSEGVSK